MGQVKHFGHIKGSDNLIKTKLRGKEVESNWEREHWYKSEDKNQEMDKQHLECTTKIAHTKLSTFFAPKLHCGDGTWLIDWHLQSQTNHLGKVVNREDRNVLPLFLFGDLPVSPSVQYFLVYTHLVCQCCFHWETLVE